MKEIDFAREMESKLRANRAYGGLFIVILVLRGIYSWYNQPPNHVIEILAYVFCGLFGIYLYFFLKRHRHEYPFPENLSKENLLNYQLFHCKRALFESALFFWLALIPLFILLISFFAIENELYIHKIKIFGQTIHLLNGKIVILSFLFVVMRGNYMFRYYKKNFKRITEEVYGEFL